MIIDIHVHPFCREAHVTPTLEDYPLFTFKETRDALKALRLPARFEEKILQENAMTCLDLT